MAAQQNINNSGLISPTTYAWDISRLFEIDVNSKEFKELLVRLYQNINRVSLALNQKTTGAYLLQELVTSNQFYADPTAVANSNYPIPFRPSYWLTVDVPILPNNSVVSIPHGIPISSSSPFTTYRTVSIKGGATNFNAQNSFIPLPYVDVNAANNISVYIDDVNVNIASAADYSAYSGMIIFEYLAS